MAPKFKFNRVFGLRLSQRMDETFSSILFFTILSFATLILINSQIDYSKVNDKAEQIIRHKYKSFVTQLLMDEVQQVEPQAKDPKAIVITAPIQISTGKPRIKASLSTEGTVLRRGTKEQAIFKKTAKRQGTAGVLTGPRELLTDANNLPEVDDYFNDIPLIDEEEISATVAKVKAKVSRKARSGVNNFDPGDVDGPPDNLFNYVVRRQGTAYLDVPEQLTREPDTEKGYRDPEEVERVVHQYSPMIEYCFQKHTKFSANNRGFVKVAFKVSYEGYVIPESVRIVNSTIRNRALEQCIKNYIRHWRNFPPLDESRGIAQVVQKFVFN